MDELQKRYEVTDSFFRRYFICNAERRFINALRRFMLWREGAFLNPKNKSHYMREFVTQELHDFYKKGLVILPNLAFPLTTRCTLRCRDCIALSPLFEDRERDRNFRHLNLTAEQFKHELSQILGSVDGIRCLFIQGGEPLLNKDLPEIIEHSAQCEQIHSVEIVTNGSILPSKELLDVLEKCSNKIYVGINNYSINPELQNRLRYEETIALLNERGIKHPLSSDLHWYRQSSFAYQGYTPEQVQERFIQCSFNYCLQVLGGLLSVCPRASIWQLMGLLNPPAEDYIDINASNTTGLRRELIAFYQKNSYAACACCAPQDETVVPAIQMMA